MRPGASARHMGLSRWLQQMQLLLLSLPTRRHQGPLSALPSRQGPSRSPHGDAAATRHWPHTDDPDLYLWPSTASPSPHLHKQTCGPPPASPSQGWLQNSEVTLHTSLWPTLTSPLLGVRLVSRTKSFQDLPQKHHPPHLTQCCPLSPAASSLPPCSPPPHGPASAHSQGEPVSACIRSHPPLLRAHLWLHPTQSKRQSPPDLQGPTRSSPVTSDFTSHCSVPLTPSPPT